MVAVAVEADVAADAPDGPDTKPGYPVPIIGEAWLPELPYPPVPDAAALVAMLVEVDVDVDAADAAPAPV